MLIVGVAKKPCPTFTPLALLPRGCAGSQPVTILRSRRGMVRLKGVASSTTVGEGLLARMLLLLLPSPGTLSTASETTRESMGRELSMSTDVSGRGATAKRPPWLAWSVVLPPLPATAACMALRMPAR